MYTLLETCSDKLDIFEFLSHVEDGLKDHHDIKVSFQTSLLHHVKVYVIGCPSKKATL